MLSGAALLPCQSGLAVTLIYRHAAAMAKQRQRRGGPAQRAARDAPELPSDMEVRSKRCTC